MIDINYLNNQPKEFSKETNTLKYLFNVLNEIKQELLYIKNNSESEFKNFDNPSKNLINSLKNSNNDINNIITDDYSSILKLFQFVLYMFTKTKKSIDNNFSCQTSEKNEPQNLNNTISNIIFNNDAVSTLNVNYVNESLNNIDKEKDISELMDGKAIETTHRTSKSDSNSPIKPTNSILSVHEGNSNRDHISSQVSSNNNNNIIIHNSLPSPSMISNIQLDEISNFSLISKIYNEINTQISESLKGSQDSISLSLKELLNQKNKFKLLNVKAEKQFKELEAAIGMRKKIDSDDKNAYNLSLKEKSDDRILNLLNDFDDLKSQINVSYEDTKKSETNLNEIIKGNFLYSLIITIQGIKKLKICFDEMIDNKIKYFRNIEKLISNSYDNITKQEYLTNNNIDYKAFFESKGFAFAALDTINLEDSFPRNTLSVVNLANIESILNFSQGLISMISSRKKILNIIQKVLSEINKSIENITYNCSKSIKNLVTPKSNLINSCAFIKQIREFLKSSFELVIKKYEEFNKYLTNSIISNIDSLLKDLVSDENSFNQFNKNFQKELNNYKSNLSKYQQNKDRASQNLEKIKELVIKNRDDQAAFQKLEKQLISAMQEEDNAKEALGELNRKYRKFCEENFEMIKKMFENYKEKETAKLKETKELLFGVMKQNNKNLSQLLEYLDFKSQIIVDDSTCINSIEKIYSNFFKELGISTLQENEFLELVKFLYEKNDFEELKLNRLITNDQLIPNLNCSITTLIKKIGFLNKDELISLKKDFDFPTNQINTNPSENNSLKEEDFKVYYEKLNFLRSNSKRISVKNMLEINRKRYEDLFYYDMDEIVNSNSFSCALSDKILLQGTLYITSKKIVFYSWFNNNTLFGTTLIEIPKVDIIDVKKQYNMIFDNSLEVHTRNVIFFFTSFVSREKCYAIIREVIFGEIIQDRKSIISARPKNSNGSENPKNIDVEMQSVINLEEENINKTNHIPSKDIVESSLDKEKNLIVVEDDIANTNIISELGSEMNLRKDEIGNKTQEAMNIGNSKSSPEENKSNISNKNLVEINKDSINIKFVQDLSINSNDKNERAGIIENIIAETNEGIEVKNEINLNVKLNKDIYESQLHKDLHDLHQSNYENFLRYNKRDFNAHIIKDKEIGDIPLNLLFNSLFNVDCICEEMKMNKTFLLSMMETRTDYGITLTKITEEDWNKKIPNYYVKPQADTNPLYLDCFRVVDKFKKHFLDEFRNVHFNDNPTSSETSKKNMISYKYSLIHPILKKRFMGPSKLNVEDNYKVFFISPRCFIVENYSYLSGFMMMDTFYSVMQFKFETDFDLTYDASNNVEGVKHKTKYNIHFGIEFVKSTMFKTKILDNAIEDTNDFVNNFLSGIFEKVFVGQKAKHSIQIKSFIDMLQKENEIMIKNSRANDEDLSNENSKKLSQDLIKEENIKLNDITEKININFKNAQEDIRDNIIIDDKAELKDMNQEKIAISDNESQVGKEVIKVQMKEEEIFHEKRIDIQKEKISNLRNILGDNIYIVFLGLCIILLILGNALSLKFEILIYLLNIFGFILVFDKLNRIERKLKII